MARRKGIVQIRLTGFKNLDVNPVPTTAMKLSQVFNVCWLLCSVLLVLPSASGLSLQKFAKWDIPEGNAASDGTREAQLHAGDFLLPSQSNINNEMYSLDSYVTSLDGILDVAEKSQNNSSQLNNITITDKGPETNNIGLVSTEQAKTLSENGILTTAGSPTNYITSVASLGESTNGDPIERNQPTYESTIDLKQSTLENSSSMEMLTTNPRTNIVQTMTEQFTMASHLDDQPMSSVNTEILLMSEISTNLESAMLPNQNSKSDVTVPQLPEDWDDTKMVTQFPLKENHNVTTLFSDMVMEAESSEKMLFTSSPGTTIPSDDKEVFGVTWKVAEEYVSNGFSNPELHTVAILNENHSVSLPGVITEMDSSQEIFAVDTTQLSEETNVTLTTAIFVDVTSQERNGEPEMAGKAGQGVMGSVTPDGQIVDNETDADLSSTAQRLSTAMPNDKGVKEDESLAGSVLTVSPVVPTEADSTATLSTVTSPAHVSVIAPPTRRVKATAAYGLDRLESEEAEEEEEEEEDEDEEDEDDEEVDDDDKDNDSVDDSAEKDSDLPVFTLPALSSQEPLEDESNVALIEGAAYQVPDTMEWEQQNQGLVRSWMEKLKDKAGYMSGMLVPVGVGIAGALFILGVLYSIKIMNRRRRNGFKRHKRKQREFNSMQDRVMLLADSSEDEF